MPQCRDRELDRDNERDFWRSEDLGCPRRGLELRLLRLPSDEYEGDLARRERPPPLVEPGLREYLCRRRRGASGEDTEEAGERRRLFTGGDRLSAGRDRDRDLEADRDSDRGRADRDLERRRPLSSAP